MISGQIRQPNGQNQREHEPLMVGAKKAAALCDKSVRTWRAWDAAGWILKPVRIGRSTLWPLAELKAWTEAGCPRRDEWERLKREGLK